VIELMGIDDEFVYTYAQNQLEDVAAGRDKGEVLCPKQMQINLTGFLEDKTPQFMLELWNLLLEAQKEPSGIPKQLILEKVKEKEMKMELFEKAKA